MADTALSLRYNYSGILSGGGKAMSKLTKKGVCLRAKCTSATGHKMGGFSQAEYLFFSPASQVPLLLLTSTLHAPNQYMYIISLHNFLMANNLMGCPSFHGREARCWCGDAICPDTLAPSYIHHIMTLDTCVGVHILLW